MNNSVMPPEPTEKMLEILMSEGPYHYRVVGDEYHVCERVGADKESFLIHVITGRPDTAHDEVRTRNAKWKYRQLLLAV